MILPEALMLKSKSYITEGPLFKSIVRFAIPILIAALIQNLFHSADMIVIGNMADSTAVASVGATANITGLVLNAFISLAGGTSVLLARSVGAGNEGRCKRIVDTSIYFSIFIGAIVAIIGNVVSVPLLRALDTPAECFDGAVTYLRIYMSGIPAIMIYNYGSAVIRAEGDSRRPLIYAIVSGLVNVGLNLVLCLIMENKVAAVAIATIVSQAVGAVLVMVRMMVNKGACRFTFKNPSFSFAELGQLMRFGIPGAIVTLMYPVASLQITGAVNSYGTACVAGCSAATNVESLTAVTYAAFSSALLTFMSQNIGAGNKDRVNKSMLYCTIVAVALGSIGLFIYTFFPEPILSIYVPGDAEAIFYGMKRMKYVLAFQMIAALNGILSAVLQAFGYPTFSSLNSIISILGLRLLWMNFIYPIAPSIDLLLVCFTCSWSLILIINISFVIPLLVRFRKRGFAAIKG